MGLGRGAASAASNCLISLWNRLYLLKIRMSVVQFHPWPHQMYYFPNTCNEAVPLRLPPVASIPPTRSFTSVPQHTISLTKLVLPLNDRASDNVQAALREQESCSRVVLRKLLANLADMKDVIQIT